MITDYKENAKLFEDIVFDNIHRTGITALFDWLKKTDFFTSPASTKYHGAFEGGLLAHSLEVYIQMMKICHLYNYCNTSDQIESATLVSLFHDVCKANSYKKSYRNVKNPESGEWEQLPCYIYDDSGHTFGAHGAESVFILNQFITLAREETIAVYHHMGAWDASKYDNVSSAYESNRLAWLLHVADEAATYVIGI